MFNKSEWSKEYNKRYYLKHKEQISNREKEKRAKNGAKPRNKNKPLEVKPKRVHKKKYPKKIALWLSAIKSKYGLYPKDWTRLVLKSNGRCAMCLTQFKNGRDCCIDHDHSTGKVRDLLCLSCNLKLGILEKGLDPINFFEISKKYLEVTKF